MIKNYNWKAFFTALAFMGLAYLAAYVFQGLHTWWAVPVALAYAFGFGLACNKAVVK